MLAGVLLHGICSRSTSTGLCSRQTGNLVSGWSYGTAKFSSLHCYLRYYLKSAQQQRWKHLQHLEPYNLHESLISRRWCWKEEIIITALKDEHFPLTTYGLILQEATYFPCPLRNYFLLIRREGNMIAHNLVRCSRNISDYVV
nr:hypothetical protein CFP56_43619 [Quercus suber]